MFPNYDDLRSQVERELGWQPPLGLRQVPEDMQKKYYAKVVINRFVESHKGEPMDHKLMALLQTALKEYREGLNRPYDNHTIEAKWTNVERSVIGIFYNDECIVSLT